MSGSQTGCVVFCSQLQLCDWLVLYPAGAHSVTVSAQKYPLMEDRCYVKACCVCVHAYLCVCVCLCMCYVYFKFCVSRFVFKSLHTQAP